jgi:hypothetical protein
MRGLLSQNGSAAQEERAKVALLGEKERALDLLEKWIVSANKATLAGCTTTPTSTVCANIRGSGHWWKETRRAEQPFEARLHKRTPV